MKTWYARFVVAAFCMAVCAASLCAADDDGWQPRSGHALVAFQDALFLTGGLYAFEKNFFFNDVWQSTDGLAWSRTGGETTYSPHRHLHCALAFQDRLWVMGGQSSDYLNDVWRSENGAQWEVAVAAAPWSARRGMACVVHNGRMYLMGGEDYTREYQNDVWTSEDGETWELLTGSAAWKPRCEHAAVSFQDALYVVGGAAEYGKYNDVWRSTDGISWTKAGALPAGIRGHCAEAFKGKIFVFGGVDGNDALLNQLWYSSDGVAWTVSSETIPWSARARHASTVFNNRLWLAGGITADGDSNDVWYSRDGVKWNAAPATGWLNCSGCGGCGETDAKSWHLFLGDVLLVGVSLIVLLRFRK